MILKTYRHTNKKKLISPHQCLLRTHKCPKWLMCTMCFSRIFVFISRQIKWENEMGKKGKSTHWRAAKKERTKTKTITQNSCLCIFFNCDIFSFYFRTNVMLLLLFLPVYFVSHQFNKWRQFSLTIENEYKWNEKVNMTFREIQKNEKIEIVLTQATYYLYVPFIFTVSFRFDSFRFIFHFILFCFVVYYSCAPLTISALPTLIAHFTRPSV